MKRKFIGCLILVISGFLISPCQAEYKPLLDPNFQNSVTEGIWLLEDELRLFENLLKADIFEELANPVFMAREDREKRAEECRIIERHMVNLARKLLNSRTQSNSQKVMERVEAAILIRDLAINYIAFANEFPGERIVYQNPDGSKDRGLLLKLPRFEKQEDRRYAIESAANAYKLVAEKWKDFGLNPPKGYIYIKVFASKESMQSFLREDNEAVGGATIPCRFIAIPWKGKVEYDSTLHHEMVHAFTGSSIGFSSKSSLPKWWHEGLATFLSDDLGQQVVEYKVRMESSGSYSSRTIESTTDKEYMHFKSVFEYIYSALGEKTFNRFVKLSLEGKDLDKAMPQALNVRGQNELFRKAEKWKEDWDSRNLLIAIAAGIAAVIGLLACFAAGFNHLITWILISAVFAFMVICCQSSIYYTKILIFLFSSFALLSLLALYSANKQKKVEERSAKRRAAIL